MSEIMDSFHLAIQNCVRAMGLLDAGYATVMSPSPLTLKLNATGLEVTEPVAESSCNVQYRETTVQGQKVVINPGLAPGDRVLVLKADAGQKYIVIAKV